MLNGIRVYDFLCTELSNLFFCALLRMFPLHQMQKLKFCTFRREMLLFYVAMGL